MNNNTLADKVLHIMRGTPLSARQAISTTTAGAMLIAGSALAQDTFPVQLWGRAFFNGADADSGMVAYIIEGGPGGSVLDSVTVGVGKDGDGINVPYFERLLQTQDPKIYFVLGTIDSDGLIGQPGDMVYAHFNSPTGTSMAQLTDGEFGIDAYFNNIEVVGIHDTQPSGEIPLFAAHSRNGRATFVIRSPTDTPITINIVDVQGRKITTYHGQHNSGSQHITLPIDSATAILYAQYREEEGGRTLNTSFYHER